MDLLISVFKFAYCFVVLAFGVFAYVKMYLKTKDKLNPFGIVCLSWCFLGAVASLHLSWMESMWTAEMYMIVMLFPFLVFQSGSRKTGRITNEKLQYIEFSSCYILLTRALFIICLACALLEWNKNGFSITLSNGAADAKSELQTIPVIHYGTIYFPYCAICSLFELIYKKKKKFLTVVYLLGTIAINILYALFVGASRGTLLIIFCAFVYLFLRKYSISLKWIIILVAGMVLAFVAISQKRIYSGSLVYQVVKGHPIVSSIYGYTALNFENLNRLTQRGPKYTIILMTYGGFMQLLGLDGLYELPEYIMTYFFNANTICYDFYEDLGLLGVIINTLVIFGFVRIIYKKSVKDRRYLLMMSVMQKAIWMVFFGNYFTIYRVMLFPYFVTALVVYSMNIQISLRRGKIKKVKQYWKGKAVI